jgi:rubredoxin
MKCTNCGGEVYIYETRRYRYPIDDKGKIKPSYIKHDSKGNPEEYVASYDKIETIEAKAICEKCGIEYKVKEE